MKKLLMAALGALLVSFWSSIPASADGGFQITPPMDRDGVTTGYRNLAGRYITFSGTTSIFDFGFESAAVQICSYDPGSQVWMRRGTTLRPTTAEEDIDGVNAATADASRMIIAATNDAAFQDGGTQALPGRAFVITTAASPGSTGVDSLGLARQQACNTYPIRTRGLIFHTATAAAASLDVRVFGQ